MREKWDVLLCVLSVLMRSIGGRADDERLAARHHVPVSARSASAGPPASLPSCRSISPRWLAELSPRRSANVKERPVPQQGGVEGEKQLPF